MSHDQTLDPVPCENLYSVDEIFLDPSYYQEFGDAFELQAQTWPPTSPIDELTSTSHTFSGYSGYTSQDRTSTSNFSSIDSIGRIAHLEHDHRIEQEWQDVASQFGDEADTASGTYGSNGYEPHHPPVRSCQELESLTTCLSAAQDPEQLPYSAYHITDRDYVPTHTYQRDDPSSAAAQDGESGLERMASFPSFTTINGPHLRNGLGMSMRRFPDISARDASSLTQTLPADISESGTQLDTQSHHSASVPAAMRCPHCNALFTGRHRNGNLGRHVRQKHKKTREYVCEEMWCDRVFMRADARLKHYRKLHPELVFDAPKEMFSNEKPYNSKNLAGDRLARQAAREEEPELVSKNSAVSSRERHSDVHAVDAASSMLTTLTRGPSVETTHKTEESPQCSDCHKIFNRLADLRRHKAAVHDPDPPQYACPMPLCVRACRPFTRKDKLNDHMAKVHGPSTAVTPRKPTTFACPEQGCGREFDQRADLLRHQRTHTDMSERPHKCGQCDKSFLYPKDLKRHEATHLGDQDEEKPSFHCPVTSCEYGPGGSGFSRKDGMLRHMKRFHPEWKEEKEEV